MRLKLKENPREWQKFTIAMMAAVSLAGFLLYRRHAIHWHSLLGIGYFALATLVLCGLKPRWFRWFYRIGMTMSFHLGQFLGRIMLTVLFFIVVTPLGLFLRLLGKDLLNVKKDHRATSYWQPVRPNSHYERPF